ncbi:MAG: ABC transporter substrate-binding protein [Geminicoccaceae bacterium]|nr:ABC transporter substrate-binding protein [Geminicoccaceae bacterium]
MRIGTRPLFGALLAAAALVATPALARDLTVTSFGGAYQDAQREVYFEPFTEATGIPLIEDSWNAGIGTLRAKAEGEGTWDVVQVESEELVLGCEEGMFEPLDWQALGGEDAYLDAAVHECGVGTIVWATIMAFDGAKFADGEAPQSWADFFDTGKFPGKRGLRKGPRGTLEFALMGDGVPPEQVYEVLATDEGVDRAFAKLESIKDDLIWWEAGAQPPQLLASGELVMTSAYNGRITAANESDNREFEIAWPAGFIYQIDSLVVMANSPMKEQAMELVAFMSAPENQSKLPAKIPYGPTNKKAIEQVPSEVAPNTPTAPENLEHGVNYDRAFWVDHVEQLNERFNSWAAQ